ncbi:hypothetical protein [Aminipila terrae]|uniref:Uncharacterized protein n=1 Tax=Aminipila terrae TaxID=2697030 RepID=A0A6P1MCY5_9FIRM|nr:hypothetical protein [Aminipila terrae]QHI72559.1 hypothetical protein Ami3637_09250 [Aminipila terrae]
MIESVGNSITDYARQERELLASKENSVKSADTKEVSASGDAAAIAESQQQISDTSPVKTKAPQYDTVEISEEGMKMARQQASSDTAALKSAVSTSSVEDSQKSSSTSTQDLSSYTEKQLDKMVDEGTITQAEKNAELARRAAKEAGKQQNSDNSTLNPEEMANVSAQDTESDDE